MYVSVIYPPTRVCFVVNWAKDLIVLPGRYDAVGSGQGQALCCAVEQLKFSRLVLLLRLLSAERNLGGHDALSLGDQSAFGTHAVFPSAVALMPLQRGHHPVIPAPGALGRSWILLRSAKQQLRSP